MLNVGHTIGGALDTHRVWYNQEVWNPVTADTKRLHNALAKLTSMEISETRVQR